jgi:hypothetical protein
MSKIVQVANAMISNPQNITDANIFSGEYYFLYKNKYRWSVKHRVGNHLLYFYPGNAPMDRITEAVMSNDWDDIDLYSSDEIGTEEAKQTFAELFNLIKEKTYGIDDAFLDILSDMEL